MAGGTWTKQNKVLPGFYLNIKSAIARALNYGESGIVAICEPLSWGPVAKIIPIGPDTDVFHTLGYDLDTSAEMLFLREIFLGATNADGSARSAGASGVLLYRPAASGAAQAAATMGNLTATAKYPGIRGNSISVSLVADPDNIGSFIVTTFVDGVSRDVQTVAAVADLSANDWVSFSGTGSLAAQAVTALAGGLNGAVDGTAYASFLTALEPEKFDVVIYDGTTETVSASMVAFVKRLCDDEGRKVRLVLPGYAQANSEIITSPVNGIVLSDGTTLTSAQSCWWAGGCAAGAKYNQDLTYAVHPNAVNVSPKYTTSQTVDLINAGNMVFFEDEGSVRIYYDINTLTTFTNEKQKVFSRNRPIRTLYYIANRLYRSFADSHFGQTDNTEDGRKLIKKDIVSLLTTMQANNAVKNFTAEDVTVEAGEDGDAIVIALLVQPVDAITKIYMKIVVS